MLSKRHFSRIGLALAVDRDEPERQSAHSEAKSSPFWSFNPLIYPDSFVQPLQTLRLWLPFWPFSIRAPILEACSALSVKLCPPKKKRFGHFLHSTRM